MQSALGAATGVAGLFGQIYGGRRPLMKTLNRPMFRYGGPIKEGVMNGIREPKRNGGSMANNQGPRRAALVGNPIYPKVDVEQITLYLLYLVRDH